MENLNTQIAALIAAVRHSNVREIKRLLAADVSPTQCDTRGQSALTVAAQIGDPEVIRLLCLYTANRSRPAQIFLQANSDSQQGFILPSNSAVNTAQVVALPPIGLHGESLAAVSILPGLTAPLEATLSHTADQDSSHHRTASQQTQAAKTNPLRKHPPHTNHKHQSSQPPTSPPSSPQPPAPKLTIKSLEAAVVRNDIKAVKSMLKAGVDLRPACWYDKPLLVVAAEKGFGEIVQALIDSGANVHLGIEQLPLHAAAANGQLDVVQRLLNSGAYIHAEAGNGRTALMEAAAAGHFLVAELLVARGANVNAVCRGETALMMAARGRHRAVYELLHPHVPPAGRVPFPESFSDAVQLNIQLPEPVDTRALRI